MRRHVRALFALSALGSLFAFTGSASAAECPNEAIRIAQGATHLPGCRAYERVSPADSTSVIGVDLTNQPMFGAMRADGNAATFPSSTAVGDSERGASRTFNLAHRSANGWSSFGVLTTTQPDVPFDQSMSPAWPTPSADMSRMMFSTLRSLGPPNPVAGNGSVYLSAPDGKGPPTWLSRWSFEGNQPNPPVSTSVPLGGTPDFSSGYFRYATPLTSLAGDDLRTSPSGLYFFEGSTIVPAGVLPSGEVNPLGAVPAGTGKASTANLNWLLPEMARNQVSADGSKLFFVSPAEGSEPRQLYVQEGGAPGRLISHDTLGNPAVGGVISPNSNNVIASAAATPDGSQVVFRSESVLTGDAPAGGIKTYRAEVSPSAITLTYLPAVTGTVLALNSDASMILFETPETVSGRSFFVWDEDRPATPSTIGTDLSSSGPEMLEPVFSEDGDVLVFASGAEVDQGFVPLPEINYTQIYRWTKQSEAVSCVSCLPVGGTPARFGSRLGSLNTLFTDNPAFPNGRGMEPFTQASVVGSRKISSDGSRVFFDTSDPLDPARDINNTRDVYMWEGGKVRLLTSGRNPIPSLVIDSSASGDDVMFITADGLVPSDTNGTYDAYDVRVNGGFPEPVSQSCEGDACQGQSSGARQAAVPGSGMLAWAGSKKESRKGKARSRKSLATTQLGRPGPNNARVRIQVPSVGRVSIAGSDVKAKARQVKPGALVIAVGLSQSGKQKLSRKGQLKTTVKVTFRPKSGAVTKKSMKLSFAGPKGGHR